MISAGSTVTVHYSLTVKGQLIDSSHDREPLTYVQGGGQILPALEERLRGCTQGDQLSVTLSPEQGYGERIADAVHSFPLESFSQPEDLEVGEPLSLRSSDGRVLRGWVTGLGESEVTLDFNHPLAGKTLEFDIEIMQIV